jgi:hypothetical protein
MIATLSALYLIAVAFTSNNHERAIHTKSDRPFNANIEEPQQPEDSISNSTAFTGTILKCGIDFLLRDTSGEVYLLDARQKGDLFEGENVRITGIPETDAKILHAQAIEQLTA